MAKSKRKAKEISQNVVSGSIKSASVDETSQNDQESNENKVTVEETFENVSSNNQKKFLEFDSTEKNKNESYDEESKQRSGFFSGDKFQKIPFCDKLQNGLKKLKFETMTKIQAQAIPHLLSGDDLVGAAKTGSGKTLAFLLPVLEVLYKVKWAARQGTGCIIISPTRELSLQTYGVLRDVCEASSLNFTHGLCIGGANRGQEAEKLGKGIVLLVATPGRLLDHLKNTKGFGFRNLQMLVIDEADRILEQGFEPQMREIINCLPKNRQTILFSATQTQNVEDLARLSMRSKPIYVGVDDQESESTVEGLEQGYVVCPSEQRFLLLFTFLKKVSKQKKIMIFFSSCKSVKFHSELLNYIDLEVMDIHGKQSQTKRTKTFFEFCKKTSGILLCTDVASRGLDIPEVDWIVQYDPPNQTAEYIHRVGRTARGSTGRGRALLFLLPQEIGFLKHLMKAKVMLNEYEFPVNKISNVKSQITQLIEKNFHLNASAKNAYRGYLNSYATHSMKDIYDVNELDLQAVAQSFGFSVPPKVNLRMGKTGTRSREKIGHNNKRMKFAKSGTFSAENPYGVRNKKDTRQFSH